MKAAPGKTGTTIKTNLIIGLAFTLVVSFLMWIRWSPIETFEEKFYDWRFKIRGTIKAPKDIAIVAIDEKSLEKLGRWPWTRNRLAEVIKRLDQSGAELIVLDIILSEKENHDPLLGKALRENGFTLVPINFDCGRGNIKSPLSNPMLIQGAFQTITHRERFNQFSPFRGKKVTVPVPEILQGAMALGHINIFADRDGTLRWETLAVEYDGFLFPSIDLVAAALFLGVPSDRLVLKAAEGVLLGQKRNIPTDPYGRMLIHYYGPKETFKHISISDILDGTVGPESLQGKIVLVGVTAPGASDLRVTPFSPDMAGVEKHANVIGSILENKLPRRMAFPVNLIILWGVSVLSILLIIRLKAARTSVMILLTILLILLTGYFVFTSWGIWMNIAYPSFNILFIFVSSMACNYATEERYARRIRTMFSSYVTERVVNELIKNPEMARLGGERREVTVLFSDIFNFTDFSEKNAPEEVVSILNEYLEAMIEVIFHWEGTLDKFIGDAIVAFWGAPLRQDNQVELAVRCALHMVKKLEALQDKWRAEGKPVLTSGIGINSGDVLVGNIGAEGKKMDYTIIGDHVNLGARVESLTRKYKTQILITEFTLNKIRQDLQNGGFGHIEIKGLEKVIVKGKKLPVRIYGLSSRDGDAGCMLIECPEDRIVAFSDK
ncbi:MAG: adenylate/guanylate cyclase domain-containing protein [Deltaproteobacteria bacterium]|nr:adenylate/guanylate cyclase domain-containing protein [Deltaproteobacteria bacterium]